MHWFDPSRTHEKKITMTNIKKICDLSWCKTHPACIFKNAQSVLKTDSYEVALGNQVNADIVICYQKENIGLTTNYDEIRQIDSVVKCNHIHWRNLANKKEVVRCSNIYCGTTDKITDHHLVPNPYRKGVAGQNKTIPLCWPCHQRVHHLKTNKQLALYYNTKSSVLNLLAEDKNFRVMRVLNVYHQEGLMAVA